MKKTLLATLMAGLFASSANAGIVIPAGEWTLDINGNVNAYASITNAKDNNNIVGGIATKQDAQGNSHARGINTGLLPAWLGFTGKSRQNDLDVEFTISFQPNVSDNSRAGDELAPLNRQAYVSFGDKSWGSVKLGKDLGVFGGDAILNDMTLLGVGGGAAISGATTTLGGIGSGYIYPAWRGQVAYTTPNWDGLSATVAITNPNQTSNNDLYQDNFGYEGKINYDYNVAGVTGKLWTSAANYKVNSETAGTYTAYAWDIGGTTNVGNLGATAYYYNGKGAGTTLFGANGVAADGSRRESDGFYLQGTYALPTKTKVGVAYGRSNLDRANGADVTNIVDFNERYTVGAYHPLTKNLNLVAEYNRIQSKSHSGLQNESDSYSAGAILFF
jgi:predicted porin